MTAHDIRTGSTWLAGTFVLAMLALASGVTAAVF